MQNLRIKKISIDKSLLSKLLDASIEFFVYVAIIGITFSNAATENGVLIGIFLWLVKKIINKDISFSNTKLDFWLGLFLFLNIFSIYNNFFLYQNEYLKELYRGFFKIIKFFSLFALIVNASSNRNTFRRMLYVFLFASIVICLDGLYQYFTGVDLFRHRTLIPNDSLRRLSAAFVHPNDFAAYLVTLIPLYIGLMYFFKRRLPKIVTFFGLTLLLFCLYKTSSRGAWLGLLIALPIFGMLKERKLLVIFIIISFFLNPIFLSKANLERIKQGFDTTSGTSWERKQIWTGAINIVKEHPFIGFGPNTFSDNFPKYKPPNYPDNRYAHNSYLQMAAEIGFVGLSLFLMIVFIVLKTAYYSFKQLFKNNKSESNIILGIFCGLIAFLIQSFFDTNLFSLVLTTLFWMMMGMIFGFYNAYVKKEN